LWSDNTTNATVNTNKPGKYWVRVNGACGVLSDTIVLKADSLPKIDLGPDTTVCGNYQKLLDVSRPNCTYLWQDGNTSPKYLITQPGVYSVTVTNFCGNAYDAIRIDKDFTTLELGNDTDLCEGEMLNLYIPSMNGSYLWNDGSTQPGISISQSGKYWLQLRTSCRTLSDTIQVHVHNQPKVELGSNAVLCKGQNIELHAGSIADSVLWSDGSNLNAKTISQSGKYWIREWNFCGTVSDSIEFFSDIQKVNLGEDTTLCNGHVLLLNAAVKGSQLLWDNGSTQSQRVIDKPARVTLEIKNNCGIRSDTMQVDFMDCDCHPWFPDAFTADENGLNDAFRLKYSCEVSHFQIEIFDRWGSMLFESNNPDFSWDGKSGGKICMEGVYVYHVEFRSATGMRYERRGTITLLR
jgi:gliding motility-associated-like protein